MKLKNKAERESYLKNYKSWDVLTGIPQIKVVIYVKRLNTGAIIYATEYSNYNGYKKEFSRAVKYHLVLPMADKYTKNSCCGFEYCVTYDPCGDSISTIVDYLTKNRDMVEI